MTIVAPQIASDLPPLEEEDESDLFCLNKTEISPEQEIRLIVREIQRLLDDVDRVQRGLIDRTKGVRNTRVTEMVEQLSELHHVLDGQLYRAENLLAAGT
jgi:hypothetical protein